MAMVLFDEEIKFIATDCYCTYIYLRLVIVPTRYSFHNFKSTE